MAGYKIGQFIVDQQRGSLHCDQHLLSSDKRTVALLMLLIETAPEAVDSKTILTKLWPDTVVSDWSVSRLISDTRKLLKQAGATFPMIQTVHGEGYRLSVEAQQQLQSWSPQQAMSIKPMNSAPPSHGRRWLWPIAAGLIVIIGAALLLSVKPTKTLQLGEPQEPVARVLWVDDHPQNNLDEVQFLQRQRVAVYTTTSSHEALMLLSMYQYDVIISDMGRAGDSLAGLKLVETLRQRGNLTPYLMYTILPSDAQTRLVIEHGAQGVAVDDDVLFEMLSKYIDIEPPSLLF